MRANIKIGLANMLPPALLAFFNHMITKLTGNPLFPDPAGAREVDMRPP